MPTENNQNKPLDLSRPTQFQIADTSTGLPRPDLANLRGSSGGFRGTKSAGWGLKLDTLPLKDIQEKKISFHRAVDYILRYVYFLKSYYFTIEKPLEMPY